MRVLGRLGLVSVGLGLMLAAHAARAQGGCTFTDEKTGKTVFWPDCQPPDEAKSAAAKGDTTKPGTAAPATNPVAPAPASSPAKSFPFPGQTPAVTPGAPGAATGQKAAGSSGAADKFPFPESDSGGSAKGGGGGAPASSSSGGPLQDAGSSGSSSSDNSGDDPTAGPLGDTDPAARAAEARRAARKKKGIDFHQTMDQREAEDLRVASFYQTTGDYRGAYERATDAVSLADDDAAAHLAVAEAARRLGKLDEAEKEYKKCLSMDPVPKVRKVAESALKQMTAGSL